MQANISDQIPDNVGLNLLPDYNKTLVKQWDISMLLDYPTKSQVNSLLSLSSKESRLILFYYSVEGVLMRETFPRSFQVVFREMFDYIGGTCCLTDDYHTFTLSMIEADVTIISAPTTLIRSNFASEILSIESLLKCCRYLKTSISVSVENQYLRILKPAD